MSNITHRITQFLSEKVISENSPKDENLSPDLWRDYFTETLRKLFQNTKQTFEQILALENGANNSALESQTDHILKNKLKGYSLKIIESGEDSIYALSVWENLIKESDDIMDYITVIYLLNSILTGESLHDTLNLARVALRGKEEKRERLTQEAAKRAINMIAGLQD